MKRQNRPSTDSPSGDFPSRRSGRGPDGGPGSGRQARFQPDVTEALGQLGPRVDGPPDPPLWGETPWPAPPEDDLYDDRPAGVFAPSRVTNEARRGGPRPPRSGRPPSEGGRPNRDRPPDPPGAEPSSLFSPRRPPSSFSGPTPDLFAAPTDMAPPSGFDDGRFFSPPQPPGSGQPSGLADDVDLLAPGVRGDAGSYDDHDGFDSLSYLRREPTPALLAAKAEPLGDPSPSRRTPRAKPAGKQTKAGRPAKTGSRPVGPATRSNRPGRPGDVSEAGRSAKSRAQAQQAARRKPKEPSKGLLALAAVGVILIGVAAGYWLTNRNKDEAGTNTSLAGPSVTADPAGTTPSTGLSGDPGTTVAPGTGAAPAGAKPTVVFNDAAESPVQSTQAYTITVSNAPADATAYVLKVDDQPVGQPAAQLAPYQFTPGRHLLQIEITGPSGTVATDPVVVYALGDVPGRTYRANLSSVPTDKTQPGGGWAEAVKQFDAFYAAGHTNVKLMPSDPYPSLKKGYWNIFVDGFADAAGAEAYCTEHGLAVPGQCFPKLFDPNAPAPAGG